MISRETISKTYIVGTGIEIGAHHNPFPVRKGVTVYYVDKRTKQQLIDGFPEIKNHQAIPETDVIDDGQTLQSISEGWYDFLLSSHQLEHCFSPLTAIENHLRILKTGGILFYAIPDKENFIDKDRPISSLECVKTDHVIQKTNDNVVLLPYLIQHYDEYLRIVDRISDPEERARIARSCIAHSQDIHFHCWDSSALFEMINAAQLMFSCQVELFYKVDHEYFVVLRKL